jgi:integrase
MQLANGQWIDRWREGGINHQRTFDLKGDRDEFRTWRRRQQQLGRPVAAQLRRGVTLGEFMEEWWEQYAVVDLETATREVYKQTWGKHILPRLGRYELRSVTSDVVLDFRARLQHKNVGDPTIVKALTVLQSIMSFAVLKGRIENNPVDKVKKPSQHADRQVPPVAPASVERMRAGMTLRDATLVSLLAYAGVRPQEALALHCEDIGERSLLIRAKVVDGERLPYTKTRRNRSVRLLAPLGQDLREYMLATGRRAGLLFPRADGEPWRKHDWKNWQRRVYRPAARGVGMDDARPYDLRGSFVSLLAWEGVPMAIVAKNAGHSIATGERHYLKIFEDFDPADTTSAEEAIRAAREPGVSGVQALFGTTGGNSG